MPSRYFYSDRPVKMGGKVYEPLKSHPIPKAHVPELIVLSEGGVVHLTETQIVPSLPEAAAQVARKEDEKPKKSKRVELP